MLRMTFFLSGVMLKVDERLKATHFIKTLLFNFIKTENCCVSTKNKIEFEIKFFVWKKIEQDFSIFNKNWKLSFLFPRVYSFWFSIDPKDIVSAIFPLIDKRICWASWNFLEPARDANPIRIFLAIIYDTLTGKFFDTLSSLEESAADTLRPLQPVVTWDWPETLRL